MDINSDEYIDLNNALSRIGENLSLYKRLLRRFIEENYYEELVHVLNKGDIDDSARQAHSLKGVSANLSLNKIRTISSNLEQLIKDGSDYSACLEELKQAYDKTIERITEIIQADHV